VRSEPRARSVRLRPGRLLLGSQLVDPEHLRQASGNKVKLMGRETKGDRETKPNRGGGLRTTARTWAAPRTMTNSGTESRTWEPAPGCCCCCGIVGGDREERFCLDRKQGEEDLGKPCSYSDAWENFIGPDWAFYSLTGLLPPNFSF
jgi:hypothetical protein